MMGKEATGETARKESERLGMHFDRVKFRSPNLVYFNPYLTPCLLTSTKICSFCL